MKNPLDEAHSHGRGNYQGDMMLTPSQLKRVKGGRRLATGRGVWTGEWVTYWPSNGTHVNIPYVINDPTFTSYERANIARAIEEYQIWTCIR